MKTVKGAPQFEADAMMEFYKVPYPREGTTPEFINKKLREWSEARRCVNCNKYRYFVATDYSYCVGPGLLLHEDPTQFSCNAFEPKETLEGL